MTNTTYAALFRNGRNQAVRLPQAYRFAGSRVRLRRFGRGVLIEPVEDDVAAWFAAMDAHGTDDFMVEGREQPPMPERSIDLD